MDECCRCTCDWIGLPETCPQYKPPPPIVEPEPEDVTEVVEATPTTPSTPTTPATPSTPTTPATTATTTTTATPATPATPTTPTTPVCEGDTCLNQIIEFLSLETVMYTEAPPAAVVVAAEEPKDEPA